MFVVLGAFLFLFVLVGVFFLGGTVIIKERYIHNINKNTVIHFTNILIVERKQKQTRR